MLQHILKRRHDIQHNDNQHNDIQHNNKLNMKISITTPSTAVGLLIAISAKCQLCLASQISPLC
jgi:hypothetical protein